MKRFASVIAITIAVMVLASCNELVLPPEEDPSMTATAPPFPSEKTEENSRSEADSFVIDAKSKEEAAIITNTRSLEFSDNNEKLAYLSEHITIQSEVIDVEFHVVYYDDLNNLTHGTTDRYIRAVFKVAPEYIPCWTDGLKKVVPYQIDETLWDDLKTDDFSWLGSEAASYYKYPDKQEYTVVYPYFLDADFDYGIVLRVISTMDIPKGYENERYENAVDRVDGYDKYKSIVADTLGYDRSIAPYIKTLQVKKAVLPDCAAAEVILFSASLLLVGTPVMLIVSDDNLICETLGERSLSTSISIADIDGDGYDEILVHHMVDSTGGAGAHETAIFRLCDGQLAKIFNYPNWTTDTDFSTGFILTLSDGYGHTIENIYTGFSCTFSRRIKWENPYFDEQGNITEYTKEQNKTRWLGVDPYFSKFEPVDIDGDGTFEILTTQYTYLFGRSDSVGRACSVLAWDKEKQVMVVKKAGFWPYVYDDGYADENNDIYIMGLQEYYNTWYTH